MDLSGHGQRLPGSRAGLGTAVVWGGTASRKTGWYYFVRILSFMKVIVRTFMETFADPSAQSLRP